MQLHAGQLDEYRRRHDPIWPELAVVLKAHGVRNYSIHLQPQTLQLFGYAEIESEERWAAIAQTPVCRPALLAFDFRAAEKLERLRMQMDRVVAHAVRFQHRRQLGPDRVVPAAVFIELPGVELHDESLADHGASAGGLKLGITTGSTGSTGLEKPSVPSAPRVPRG